MQSEDEGRHSGGIKSTEKLKAAFQTTLEIGQLFWSRF